MATAWITPSRSVPKLLFSAQPPRLSFLPRRHRLHATLSPTVLALGSGVAFIFCLLCMCYLTLGLMHVTERAWAESASSVRTRTLVTAALTVSDSTQSGLMCEQFARRGKDNSMSGLSAVMGSVMSHIPESKCTART